MSDLAIEFDRDGLIPVVVQDYLTGEIRMFAHATIEAVRATLATGRATFWSRSRNELWEKGQTSGNVLHVKRVLVDCDDDCLVYSSDPAGATCHTGAPSCFFQTMDAKGNVSHQGTAPQTLIARLEAEIENRRTSSTSEKSYTKSLLEGGALTIAKKITEEANELGNAIASESEERVAAEAADVLYHVMVGLRSRGVAWRDVLEVLEARTGTSGHAEKASRVAKTAEETANARAARSTIP